MDAINVATGAEEPGFPVELGGTAQNAPGRTFHPTTQLQRPGLLLMEGVVYAAFGSDCDDRPWQGWIFGVSTAGTSRPAGSPDDDRQRRRHLAVGRGPDLRRPGHDPVQHRQRRRAVDADARQHPPANLGESVVRLQVQTDGSLKAVDFFAPFDAAYLDTWDADFASGGVTGLPEEYFGTPSLPHLAVAVGKDGYVYLLNRDYLGGIGQGPRAPTKSCSASAPTAACGRARRVARRRRLGLHPDRLGWHERGAAPRATRVYQYGALGHRRAVAVAAGTSRTRSASAPARRSSPPTGPTPGSALVWIVWAPNGNGAGAQLRAYDPMPVKASRCCASARRSGPRRSSRCPAWARGRLYVGTRDGHVLAFGSPVTPALSGSATAFGTTTIGESSEKTLTLTATEALTLSSLDSSSSQFTLGAPSPAAARRRCRPARRSRCRSPSRPRARARSAATLTATTSTGKTANSRSRAPARRPAPAEATPPLVTFGGTSRRRSRRARRRRSATSAARR